MDPLIQQISVNAVAAAAVIVVLIIVFKDRRADAKDRKEAHDAREHEQVRRDQMFCETLAHHDADYITAQRARDELFAASIERITRDSMQTAAECHLIHTDSIVAMHRTSDTNERVVRVLERIELHAKS